MAKSPKGLNLFKLALGLEQPRQMTVQGQRGGQQLVGQRAAGPGQGHQGLDVLRIVECPICTEIPFPPIYMCSIGHNICKSCKPKLKECPTCKAELTDKRNYTVEEIVLASKHSCPFKIDGCKIEKTGELLEAHVQNCQYRSFACPRFGWENCWVDSLTLPNTRDHFLKAHDAKSRSGPYVLVRHNSTVAAVESAENCQHSPSVLLEYDGQHFLIQTFASSGCIFWAVMLIGSEDRAKNYRANIISQRGCEKEIQWLVPVISVTEGAELAKNGNNSKVFMPSCPIQYFKQMADLDKTSSKYTFNTSYTIVKKWK